MMKLYPKYIKKNLLHIRQIAVPKLLPKSTIQFKQKLRICDKTFLFISHFLLHSWSNKTDTLQRISSFNYITSSRLPCGKVSSKIYVCYAWG